MGVTPVNLARVSFQMRAYNLREALRGNTSSLYDVQNQLATGLRFTRPSQDPTRAAAAIRLDGRLDRLSEVQTNVANVNSVLTQVEYSMQEAVDLMREANTLAIEGIDDGLSADERSALATTAASLIDQLIAIGNSKYLNTNLFSGQEAVDPFELTLGGVLYRGDGNRRETIVDTDLTSDFYTVPGTEFFKALSAQVTGAVDLNPAVTTSTRIADLNGAAGKGVSLGRIVVGTAVSQVEIDLSGAETVGDVVDTLNAQLPSTLSATLSTQGINIQQTGASLQAVSITDVGSGTTARDLGLSGTFASVTRPGADLDPRLTNLTTLGSLRGGSGLPSGESFVIHNGEAEATISLSGCKTVEDLLNRINVPELGVQASISDDGAHLNIVSRVAGTELTIEENNGTLATALGVRSLYGGTRLSDLNDGQGLGVVTGDDLRIVTADNTTIDVDLSSALTVQDVIDQINTAAAGAVTVSLRASGNGLQIQDNTAGAGTLTVSALNASTAVVDLGLDGAASGGVLLGTDVNPLRVDGPFTALLELQKGLQSNDRQLLQRAADRLDNVMREMETVQGKVAAQAKMMDERAARVETEVSATRILLSDVQDVDFTDAAVRYQQLQTALQANLSTSSQVFNLSLLDYL